MRDAYSNRGGWVLLVWLVSTKHQDAAMAGEDVKKLGRSVSHVTY